VLDEDQGEHVNDSVVALLPDGSPLVAVHEPGAHGPGVYSLRLGETPLFTVDGRNGEPREPALAPFQRRPPVAATPAPFGNAWVRAGDEANEVAWLVQPRLGLVVQWTTVDRDEDGYVDCPGVAPWLPRAFPLGRPPAYVVVRGGENDGHVVPILGRTVVRDEGRADAIIPSAEPYELVIELDAEGFFAALSDPRGRWEGHVPHGAVLRVGALVLRVAYHLDDRVVWHGSFTGVPPAELSSGRESPDRLGAHEGSVLLVSIDGVGARFTTGPHGYTVSALDEPSALTKGDRHLAKGADPALLRHGDALAFSDNIRRVFRYSPHPAVEMPVLRETTSPQESPSRSADVLSTYVPRLFQSPEPSPAELAANLLRPARPRLREVLLALRRWRIDVLSDSADPRVWQSLTTRDYRCRFPLFDMASARPRRYARRALHASGIEPGAGIEEVAVPDLALALALTSDPSGAATAEALAVRAADLAPGGPGIVEAIRWSVLPWYFPRVNPGPPASSITDAARAIATDPAFPPGVRSLATWQLLQYDAWRTRAREAPSGPAPDDPHLLLLRILALGYLVDGLDDGVLDLVAPMPDLTDEDDPTANAAGPFAIDRFLGALDARMKRPRGD